MLSHLQEEIRRIWGIKSARRKFKSSMIIRGWGSWKLLLEYLKFLKISRSLTVPGGKRWSYTKKSFTDREIPRVTRGDSSSGGHHEVSAGRTASTVRTKPFRFLSLYSFPAFGLTEQQRNAFCSISSCAESLLPFVLLFPVIPRNCILPPPNPYIRRLDIDYDLCFWFYSKIRRLVFQALISLSWIT